MHFLRSRNADSFCMREESFARGTRAVWDAVSSSTHRKVLLMVGSVHFAHFITILRWSQSNYAPLRVRSHSFQSGGLVKRVMKVVNYTGITKLHSNYVL